MAMIVSDPQSTGSTTTRVPELQTKLIVLAILCIFFVSWFVAHGVSTRDAIVVIVIIGIQTAGGSALWSVLQNGRQVGLVELLGMGFAIGSITSTSFDQLLLATPARSIGWLIPVFVSGALWIKNFRNQLAPLSHDNNVEDEIGLLALVLLSVFLGRGLLIGGWFWGTIVMATGVVIALWFNVRLRDSFRLLLIGVCAILGSTLIYLMKPAIDYGSWVLHPLYTGTDDQVFSEGLAFSVAHFGPQNYASAVNTSVRYHWFSLAWSGMVGRVGHIAPFVMTLHVVPAIAFAGIAALLIALVHTIKASRTMAVIAVVTVFATNSAPDPLRFFYILNTTNVLPHVWVLSFAVAFSLHLRGQIRAPRIVLPVLAAATILAKIPYATVLIAGTIAALAVSLLRDRRHFRKLLTDLGICWMAMGLTYLLFLTPHDWEQRSYYFVSHLTFLGYGARLSLFLVAILFATRFVGAWWIKPASLQTDRLILIGFLVGSIAAGLLRFVIIGNSAEQYFINEALVLGATASAWGITQIIPTENRRRTSLYGAVGMMSAIFAWWILSNWNLFRTTEWIASRQWLKLLLPFAVSIVTVSVTMAATRIFHKSGIRVAAFAIATFAIFGSSVGVFIYQARNPLPYLFTTTVASNDDLDALTWLRHNSKPDEIIATNRYLCAIPPQCQFDDSSFLISAVANRQVLIEGPRFVVGASSPLSIGRKPYPLWVTDRINLSSTFANSPSQQLFERLREFGVTWFYLDSQFTASDQDVSKIMKPWGSIAFNTGQIWIIKLRN